MNNQQRTTIQKLALASLSSPCFDTGGIFVTAPPGTSARFNPPPNWPTPPPGWTPPPSWTPDPAWPPAPEGWQFWVTYPTAPPPAWDTQAAPFPGTPWYRKIPKWRYAAVGTAVVGIVVADVVPGGAGHVMALVVWIAAGVLCVRPAISKAKTNARIWARIGLAVCIVFAAYAGSLAAGGHGLLGDNYCLFNMDDDQWGGSGVLAVPQANATQAACDQLGVDDQQQFDDGGAGSMMTIVSDKPGYLSERQQENDKTWGTTAGLQGWYVVSGTVGGVPSN